MKATRRAARKRPAKGADEGVLGQATRGTDERILVEAAQRDPAEFEALYELHFEHVYAFVAGRVRDRATAEDVTSEVFHKALANLRNYEWRGVPFVAWLLRIAANAVADHAKRAAREFPATDDPPEPAVPHDLQDSEMRAIEHRAQLFRLVGQLPEVQRQVVHERFVEQRSIREIAQRLGKTEGAVKQLQLRAVQNLRRRWRAAMAKRSLAMQFDEVVQAMLVSLRPRPEKAPDPGLASLARFVQELRDLPREEFRAALKSDLQRRASMSEGTATSKAATGEAQARAVHYMRPGLTAITPYIIVRPAAQFIEFLKSAFEGTERTRMPAPDGSIMHAEVAVGNGAIEVSDGNEEYPTAPAEIHIYLKDADAAYAKALEAGAASLYPPVDQDYGDREGGVKDAFGNVWYIATPKGWTPGPEGLRSVQPFLHLHEAHKMIPFMEATFGAEAMGTAKSPEGAVLHGTIRIGNATLEISEAHGEFQPMPCHLHVYVPDTDACYARALQAGASSIEAPQDKPYGDRSAGVKDAWGNSWFIATYLGR